jgi:VWFA-related protein
MIRLLILVTAIAAAQEPTTFRTGTRLVQIDVVVRDKNGPVKGLTKEDFTVFDQGKRQQIAVFHDPANTPAVSRLPLPSGAVSNRRDSHGNPLANATVLLLDQLNTAWDNSAYSRSWALKFLGSRGENERIAVYMLGNRLGIVQDFTDDPETLARAVAHWDPKTGPLGAHWMDNPMFGTTGPYGTGENIDLVMERVTAPQYAATRHQITMEAVARIAGHLSGMPGRRNLVWLAESPQLDPPTLAPLRAAAVALYPVLVRGAPDGIPFSGALSSGDHQVMGVTDPRRNQTPSTRDKALQAVAASTGGFAFTDVRDLGLAVHRAEEDAASAYTLGYYPAEETLDGKLHQLKVVVTGAPELHYRSGYIASRTLAPSVGETQGSPLNATGIGLTATASADSARPATYKVRVTVDLHDVRLDHAGSLRTGALNLTFLDPVSGASRTTHLKIELADDKFASALEQGFPINMDAFAFDGPEFVVIVADKATGLTGSLHVRPGSR